MMKKLKKENGSALVMVLIVFTITLILAPVLFNVAMSEHKQNQHHMDLKQAEYLALAGLDIYANYIMNEDTKGHFINTFKDNLNSEVNTKIFNDQVEIMGNIVNVKAYTLINGIRLESTGEYKGIKQTRYLELKNKVPYRNYIFPFSKSGITDSSGYEWVNIPPEEITTEIISIKLKNTTTPDYFNNMPYHSYDANNQMLTIDYINTDSGKFKPKIRHYNEIKIDKDQALKFVVPLGQDLQIIVNDFELEEGGFLIVEGGGRLMIFVEDRIEFKNSFLQARDNLSIFLNKNASATFDLTNADKREIYTTIYAPNVKNNMINMINIQYATIKGGIIAPEGSVNTLVNGKVEHRHPERISGYDKYIQFEQTYEYEIDLYY